MTIVALVVALLGCAFILFIGVRFLLAPRVAMAGFGVPEDRIRALTSIKGVRDVTSGIVPLVVLAAAGQQAFGWALVAAAITPIGDAIIVTTNGGTLPRPERPRRDRPGAPRGRPRPRAPLTGRDHAPPDDGRSARPQPSSTRALT